jgi:hypothetical protein
MKSLRPLLALVLSASSAPSIGTADEAEKIVITDAVTNDQLAAAHRRANSRDPLRELGKPVGKVDEDPAKAILRQDLIKDSTILCYRGFLTLVPKQAVLHVPEALAGRIGAQPGAQVKTWPEFYRMNRGWLREMEVSPEQSRGQSPISEETREAFTSGNAIVIATFKSGPISVMPLAETAPADPATGEASAPDPVKP